MGNDDGDQEEFVASAQITREVEARMFRRFSNTAKVFNWIYAIVAAIVVVTAWTVILYKNMETKVDNMTKDLARYRQTQRIVYKAVFGQELPP